MVPDIDMMTVAAIQIVRLLLPNIPTSRTNAARAVSEVVGRNCYAPQAVMRARTAEHAIIAVRRADATHVRTVVHGHRRTGPATRCAACFV
jgi:hypothetical protein